MSSAKTIRFDAILSSAISNKNDPDFVYRFFRADERRFYPLIVLDRGGWIYLIEIHIFFRNRRLPLYRSFFFHYLNHLQFKFRKTEDNIVVETKIFNAHLHRDNDNIKAESSIFRASTLRFLSNIIFDKEST